MGFKKYDQDGSKRIPVTGEIRQKGPVRRINIGRVSGCQYCIKGNKKILKPCAACGL